MPVLIITLVFNLLSSIANNYHSFSPKHSKRTRMLLSCRQTCQLACQFHRFHSQTSPGASLLSPSQGGGEGASLPRGWLSLPHCNPTFSGAPSSRGGWVIQVDMWAGLGIWGPSCSLFRLYTPPALCPPANPPSPLSLKAPVPWFSKRPGLLDWESIFYQFRFLCRRSDFCFHSSAKSVPFIRLFSAFPNLVDVSGLPSLLSFSFSFL